MKLYFELINIKRNFFFFFYKIASLIYNKLFQRKFKYQIDIKLFQQKEKRICYNFEIQFSFQSKNIFTHFERKSIDHKNI